MAAPSIPAMPYPGVALWKCALAVMSDDALTR